MLSIFWLLCCSYLIRDRKWILIWEKNLTKKSFFKFYVSILFFCLLIFNFFLLKFRYQILNLFFNSFYFCPVILHFIFCCQIKNFLNCPLRCSYVIKRPQIEITHLILIHYHGLEVRLSSVVSCARYNFMWQFVSD